MSTEAQYLDHVEAQLESIYTLPVIDPDNNKIPFGDLVKKSEGESSRRVIIFIRHFFCGRCEEFVAALSKELPPKRLEGLEPKASLAIIGCGDASLIRDYKKRTNCPFDMYADPERAIYGKLDFSINLKPGQTKPSHITKSMASVTASSFVVAVSAGTKALSGGHFSQNGGDFIWKDGQLEYAKRMETTTDHVEIEELYRLLSSNESGNGDEQAALNATPGA